MAATKLSQAKKQKPDTAASGLLFLIVSAILLPAILLLLDGCSKSKTPDVDRTVTTPTERKKSELLKKLDRKFENSDDHYELGQLYHNEGMLVKAEYEYNIALSFDPAHKDAQAAMVKVLLDSSNKPKSDLAADIYINQASGSAAESLKLAMAFQHQRLDEYAMACYRQALNLAPNSAKINRQIGLYHLSKGDKDRAKDYLVRSFQLNPHQPEVAGELGRLGIEVKIPRKKDESARKLDRMIEQSDKSLTQ